MQDLDERESEYVSETTREMNAVNTGGRKEWNPSQLSKDEEKKKQRRTVRKSVILKESGRRNSNHSKRRS